MSDIKETVEATEETAVTEDEVCKTPVKNSVVVNHVMYPENAISGVLSALNSINITGAENAMKLADAYRTLSTMGQVVPVTIEN